MNQALQTCADAATTGVGFGGFMVYTLLVVFLSVWGYRKMLKNNPEKVAALAAAAKKAGEKFDKL